MIEDNHEAIVPKLLFDSVQRVLQRDTRRSPDAEGEAVSLFSGMVFCGDCGASIRTLRLSSVLKVSRS